MQDETIWILFWHTTLFGANNIWDSYALSVCCRSSIISRCFFIIVDSATSMSFSIAFFMASAPALSITISFTLKWCKRRFRVDHTVFAQ